jgi:hypothetical protein
MRIGQCSWQIPSDITAPTCAPQLLLAADRVMRKNKYYAIFWHNRMFLEVPSAGPRIM